MSEKCPNCGQVIKEGQKFCSYCGQDLLDKSEETTTSELGGEEAAIEQTKGPAVADIQQQTPQPSPKNKKGIALLAGLVAIIALAVFFFWPKDSINGEWIAVDGFGIFEEARFEIKNSDSLKTTFAVSGEKTEVVYSFPLHKPESSGDPYTTNQLERVELIVRQDERHSTSININELVELGYTLEEDDEFIIISTEDSDILTDEDRSVFENYVIYQVGETLEVINDYSTYFAIRLENISQELPENYMDQYLDVLDRLHWYDEGGVDEAKKLLAEIKANVPESKMLSLFEELTELTNDFKIATEVLDTDKMSDVVSKMLSSPIGHVFGFNVFITNEIKEYLTYAIYIEGLEAGIEQAETMYQDDLFEDALTRLEINEETLALAETYAPETYQEYKILTEKILTNMPNRISFENFKGYWAPYDGTQFTDYGNSFIYVSDDYFAISFVQSEYYVDSITDYSVDDTMLSLDLQPLYGQSMEEYEPFSLEFGILETERGPAIQTPDSDTLYYQITEEQYYESNTVNFEEAGNNYYEGYLKRQEEFAKLKENPETFFLDNIFKGYGPSTVVTHSFRSKRDHPGIGEYWHHRETTLEDGTVNQSVLQWLIHDITFEDNIFQVHISDFNYQEGDDIDIREFKYMDDFGMGQINPSTGEVVDYLSKEFN